jgi:hypothetical protein
MTVTTPFPSCSQYDRPHWARSGRQQHQDFDKETDMTRMNPQKVAKVLTIALSGVLAVGLAAATAASAFAQAHDTWTFTGRMHTARLLHTATLLRNGQVLVAGGLCGFATRCDTPTVLAEAELYNPSTGQWTLTGSMSKPRYGHTATLLANGQVLVTGGFEGNTSIDSAELYNPSIGKWSSTGSMTVARGAHGAALLEDGEVLVTGGDAPTPPCGPNCIPLAPTAAAELYNPSTGTFTATGSMNDARAGAQLTLLQNGEVLNAGGGEDNVGCTAELFSNGQWRLTSELADCGTISDTAALLPSGDVVIFFPSQFYDPSTNFWQATLDQPNAGGVLASLANGKVLLAGHGLTSGSTVNVELYDPSTNEWTPTGSMHVSRNGLTLTRLLNGQVLAAGGNRPAGDVTLSSAELYTP